MRIRFDGATPYRLRRNCTFAGRCCRISTGVNGARRARVPVQDDPSDILQLFGPPLDYQVTLEPNQRPWLLVLDATGEPPRLQGLSTCAPQRRIAVAA